MNTAKNLRLIAELTQAQAADLIGVSIRTWKAWEASGATLKSDKVEAFKHAMTRRDLSPSTGVQGALEALRERGRRDRPAWYSDADPYGQRSGDPFRTRTVHTLPDKVEDEFVSSGVTASGEDMGDDEINDLENRVVIAKSQGGKPGAHALGLI